MRKKRDLFSELMAGIEEVKQHETGKITLKTSTVEPKTMLKITTLVGTLTGAPGASHMAASSALAGAFRSRGRTL